MWENKTKKQAQQAAPIFLKTKKEEPDSVLLVQSALCLLAVLIAVAVRAALPALWQEMRGAGNEMLSSGISFEGDTEFARFASAAASELEHRLSDWKASEESGGIGGFSDTPLQKRVVPDGASLDVVEFQDSFTLPLSGRITSPFGFRTNPLTGGDEFHLGTDISAAVGTPVAAARGGQVCRTGYSAGRGNYIVIRHGEGVQTLYQHLSCGLVRAGEIVEEGQIIALSGETGNVTGPHLHLELLVDGICINPACALPQLAE